MLPAVLPISEDVCSEVEDPADGWIREVISNVVPDNEVAGGGHTIDSGHSRNKGETENVNQFENKKMMSVVMRPWLLMHQQMLMLM